MVLGIKMTNSALIMNKAFKFGLIIGNSPSLDNYRYEVRGYKATYQLNRRSMVSQFNPASESNSAKISLADVTSEHFIDDLN